MEVRHDNRARLGFYSTCGHGRSADCGATFGLVSVASPTVDDIYHHHTYTPLSLHEGEVIRTPRAI